MSTQKVFYSLSTVICSQIALFLVFECLKELGECWRGISLCPTFAHTLLVLCE